MRLESSKIHSEFCSHGFFRRKYGKSLGVYASLNCSKFVGDNEDLVAQNLDLSRQALGADRLVTLNQVHGNLCITVDERTEISDMKADAVVTRTPGIAIGILTADCAPILFFDRQNLVVGAAHAGWKGAVAGIIPSTVNRMADLGSRSRDIIAAVGPCITVASYDVDEDFRRNFREKSGREEVFCIVGSKLYFDLPKFCKSQLLEAGLEENNIDLMDVDTYLDQENYFSYRFANRHNGGICGRSISAICLGKV
ncbi:MAG: peptidoglycan editing factor PgeF [Holosporaceae bacterium]|nr:peptidoglycan editing factor PgeF [Holosporaceae bacterium]